MITKIDNVLEKIKGGYEAYVCSVDEKGAIVDVKKLCGSKKNIIKWLNDHPIYGVTSYSCSSPHKGLKVIEDAEILCDDNWGPKNGFLFKPKYRVDKDNKILYDAASCPMAF